MLYIIKAHLQDWPIHYVHLSPNEYAHRYCVHVFYELNKTANFIWKEATKGQKLVNIIKAMQKKYRRKDLQKDALDFVNDLLKKKIFLLRKDIF